MVSVNMCLIGIVLFVFAVKSCDSIKCYACVQTDACKDKFTTDSSLLSGDTCAQCYKVKTTDDQVTRGCSATAIYNIGCEETSVGSTQCACDTDSCNGASALSVSTTVAFFLSGLALCLF